MIWNILVCKCRLIMYRIQGSGCFSPFYSASASFRASSNLGAKYSSDPEINSGSVGQGQHSRWVFNIWTRYVNMAVSSPMYSVRHKTMFRLCCHDICGFPLNAPFNNQHKLTKMVAKKGTHNTPYDALMLTISGLFSGLRKRGSRTPLPLVGMATYRELNLYSDPQMFKIA